MDRPVLDRFYFAAGDGASFSDWLYAWQAKWHAGARVRVLIARDDSHAIIVADPDAPSSSSRRPTQLRLDL
jgi:phosphatidylethanolamine-binding protein (PEBP) family uncharacterized protein